MESIVQIRQMMADQKYYDVQLLIEVQLTINHESRHELLLLYLEALENQDKKLPAILALELAEFESQLKNYDFVLKLISSVDGDKYFLRIIKLKVKAAEDKGRMDKLYDHLSDFYIHQFEHQVPNVPSWIETPVQKYFKNDFNLKLKMFALMLLLKDLEKSEDVLKELIISCVEKSSPRGIVSKLESIADVLRSVENKAALEIYQSFCLISVHGISEKSDYKRLIEMVIFFEDFRFQILTLNLLHQLNLIEECEHYAVAIRSNPQYSFVYLDKFFSDLKSYFLQPRQKDEELATEVPTPDLELTDNFRHEVFGSRPEIEDYEEEKSFLHLLKYQSYTTDQLCDLAVSFLQSEMPKVALRAAELAIASSTDDKEFLKGSYLKLTCLLLLSDYRAALDTCLEALSKSRSRDDILSFLYGQAEVYIRLNEPKEAKKILSKVLSIDSKYRMAKERLEKL